MATSRAVDGPAAGGSGGELPAWEDAAGGRTARTDERRLVDVLLDISEEDFSRELEPFEYHCYSGWEQAVQGWARAAPLSCILLAQRYKKPKQKEAEAPAGLPGDPADSSASNAEHRCESTVGPHTSVKKPVPLQQRTGFWSRPSVADLHKGASEWALFNATQKTTPALLFDEKVEEEGTLRGAPSQPHHLSSKCSVSETRPAKPQKHRPSNTVVPIKNFTFLPPIKSPHLNPQRVGGDPCGGKKAPEGETIEESCYVFDKKSGSRGKRGDAVASPAFSSHYAALTPKYRTCQRSPYLLSALSVSVPKRYQVPASSSRPDAVHSTCYAVARSFTQALQSGAAAAVQAHVHPSKTVCAVKLYEGREINV